MGINVVIIIIIIIITIIIIIIIYIDLFLCKRIICGQFLKIP